MQDATTFAATAPWWGATIALILVLLAVDFLLAARRPHAVGMREAALWSVFYVAVAVAFGVALLTLGGAQAGAEYFAGYIVEKSLSVDNLFVFVIIMARFAVPAELQQRVLLFGIAAALVMRAVFIAVGAAALAAFSFLFVVFGLFLIVTGIQLARHYDEDPDGDNALMRVVRRRLPATDEYDGTRLVTRRHGQRLFTPLFLVFVAIASSDLLFALDSIPAVFGITKDPFIVFAANAFALLGLRALYFLIHGLLDRLVYLSLGLSAILVFIGVKMILLWLHEDVSAAVPHIPTPVSLGVILGILAITTVASLVRSRAHPEEKAHAGRLTASSPRSEAERSRRS